MDLRTRLSKLKTQNGLTTEQLSERSGVPKGTINKLLNGETRNPTTQTLRRLAEALGCPLDALLDKPDDIPGVCRLSRLRPSAPPIPDGSVIMPVSKRRIPLLGEIAAGQPIFCDEVFEVADTMNGVSCDFALRVRGDSMVGARIHDGDVVFIRAQDDVDDGQIAAVIVDNEATLKRVYHIPNGLQLLSENPKYPPMLYTLPDHTIRILGLAVSMQTRLC